MNNNVMMIQGQAALAPLTGALVAYLKYLAYILGEFICAFDRSDWLYAKASRIGGTYRFGCGVTPIATFKELTFC